MFFVSFQGVVSGVLLVTPNAIMFDPNVSDPLVIEHGADIYGMIAPMETVISAAMYHDIAAMKLKGVPRSVDMLVLYVHIHTGMTLGLRPANERRRYFVTTSLIGWAQA